jgi:hypothetical protein
LGRLESPVNVATVAVGPHRATPPERVAEADFTVRTPLSVLSQRTICLDPSGVTAIATGSYDLVVVVDRVWTFVHGGVPAACACERPTMAEETTTTAAAPHVRALAAGFDLDDVMVCPLSAHDEQ